MKPVKFIDLAPQEGPLREELLAAFTAVLDSRTYILGAFVESFEAAVGAYLGVPFALGMSSGTDALLAALMALDIGAGDEVLCPSFTFFATAGTVARLGAKPVFVDSCPCCYAMDPWAARSLITSRTKAIIPVHLFGQPADLSALMSLAQEHNLWVIEDVAQAMGASFEGRQAGTLGHFGAFSFYPTKTLGALGDAGMLVTNDPVLFKKAQAARTHGSVKRYYHESVGGNFRIDALQAALLQVKLPHLSFYNQDRQTQAQRYNQALSSLPGVELPQLSAHCRSGVGDPGLADASILLPSVHPGRTAVWSLYTLRVLKGMRAVLAAALQELGIATDVYYPRGLHQQPCFTKAHQQPELPVAEALSQEVLSLPLYPGLTPEDQDRVIAALKNSVPPAAGASAPDPGR